jgi:hypothetical protein
MAYCLINKPLSASVKNGRTLLEAHEETEKLIEQH